jgi:hypothetical protein
MPMHRRVIGQDSDGNDVLMVWGDKLNWARGVVDVKGEMREYYRAQGNGNAHYAVMRDLAKKRDDRGQPLYNYWYVAMHIDGQTTNLPTEFMSALEGKEVCQIFENERGNNKTQNKIQNTKRITNNSE